MPRRSTADRTEYERQRQERRRKDPDYKTQRNARNRQRYAEDPDYRTHVRTYNQEYRTQGSVNLSTQNARRSRGMIWTPEQEAQFLLETHCAVCGKLPTKRGLFADHCHDCRMYRGPLCQVCNTDEAVLRKWDAVCPSGSPMRLYMDRHDCGEADEPAA
jgi:hypothetical protein